VTRVYVGIGSNIDRERYIGQGLAALRSEFGELTVSSIYESEPVGFHGGPFYNLVVGFNSDWDADSIWRCLRAIETANGRPADGKKFTSRTLDLDLLLFGDLVSHDGGLKLPRDDIDRYAFVLAPLAEIAPGQKHPVHQQGYAELWQQMDKSLVRQRCLGKLDWLSEALNPGFQPSE